MKNKNDKAFCEIVKGQQDALCLIADWAEKECSLGWPFYEESKAIRKGWLDPESKLLTPKGEALQAALVIAIRTIQGSAATMVEMAEAGELDKRPWSIEDMPPPAQRCVIIESPYKGDFEKHEEYGSRCLADCLSRGEAPFASHLLYTRDGVLDDTVAEEREQGISSGLSIGDRLDVTVVYTDHGITDGMTTGIRRARAAGRKVEYRQILGGANG